MCERIQVVAAVIYNPEGEVLIAQRHESAHQGGLWEFPGGKRETGESPRAALARELLEELGIRPVRCQPWLKISHDYLDKKVLLDIWKVSSFTGQPYGREGQQIRWCSLSQLSEYRFPAANRPVLEHLACDQLIQTS